MSWLPLFAWPYTILWFIPLVFLRLAIYSSRQVSAHRRPLLVRMRRWRPHLDIRLFFLVVTILLVGSLVVMGFITAPAVQWVIHNFLLILEVIGAIIGAIILLFFYLVYLRMHRRYHQFASRFRR